MEYKIQTLKAGSLTGQYEAIQNFQITKPTWKQTFGEEFFLTASDSLEGTNESITNVLDVQAVNGVDNVLSYDGAVLKLSINGSVVYTGTKGESERLLVMRGGYDTVKTTTITEIGSGEPTQDDNDPYEFGYIKLKCASNPAVGEYITFTSNTKNLQGVSTRVHYVQGGYIYVRGTNLYGTLPNVGDTLTVHDKIGDVAVIAENDKVVAVYDDGSSVDLYVVGNNDKIVDIETFNQGLFVLTDLYVFYSRSLVNCNLNIYPLDFFDNMIGGTRIIKFGKHLLLLGNDNQLISPVNGTAGSLGYIAVDLNYNHKLFSKYSTLVSQGSMYILQEDKNFVEVNIISTSNTEYELVTKEVLNTVQGMLDEVEGEVYMSKNDRYISIINDRGDGTSVSYNYNVLYDNWMTQTHDVAVRSLGDKPYGETQFTYGNDIVPQCLSFHLGGNDLHRMKMCFFVKYILVAEENKVPDYELIVEKYIGGQKQTRTLALKDYPINNTINAGENTMGYEQFGEVDITVERHRSLGYIITPKITINETADLFVFKLKNKDNVITYGGSVIGYRNMLPEMTGYNYNTKQSTRSTGTIN